MIRTIIMIFIIGFSSVFSFSETHLSRKIYNLPDDSPGFKFGVDIIVVGEDIIVLENRSHQLFKFHVNGSIKFIKTIGRKGKGPSDLHLPSELSFWNGVIAVKDEEGVSFFDGNGGYLDKFRLFSPRISFVFVNDKIYFASSIPSKQYLIGVYNKKGKLLMSFGEKFLNLDFNFHKKASPFFSEKYFYSGKLLSDGSFIYYLNAKFGKVFKFDLEGKKVVEKDISEIFGDRGRRIVNKNNDILNKGLKPTSKNAYLYLDYKLFQDAFLFKEKIYIITTNLKDPSPPKTSEKINDDYISVICKNSLNSEKKYLIKLNDDERIHSFAVTEKDGRVIFYAPMFTKEGTDIAVFKEKEPKEKD
ncbi:MAG: hypothetical protein GTO45_11680 [Candidatus Aminicenantes bacterium]|nr:hypothetical protein [Candidatus Aminicenantes bacterium]NIM79465.1 hypothetical protein [Candidatus Aminicenantes bacterium]NIN18751.1 hypothetical protein [Candidatus Aminicenantes bacterium]NIN42673.1 hypothetical protein [Candidatus Aminicenantes bacterium]NIN85407.1 hypothetical protein [Candidatus Aminicenantes bacterium]